MEYLAKAYAILVDAGHHERYRALSESFLSNLPESIHALTLFFCKMCIFGCTRPF